LTPLVYLPLGWAWRILPRCEDFAWMSSLDRGSLPASIMLLESDGPHNCACSVLALVYDLSLDYLCLRRYSGFLSEPVLSSLHASYGMRSFDRVMDDRLPLYLFGEHTEMLVLGELDPYLNMEDDPTTVCDHHSPLPLLGYFFDWHPLDSLDGFLPCAHTTIGCGAWT